MIDEAHDEIEDGYWLVSLWAAFSAWRELLRVDKVILTEDHYAGTVVFDSTSKRTIGENVEVWWGDGGKGLKQ